MEVPHPDDVEGLESLQASVITDIAKARMLAKRDKPTAGIEMLSGRHINHCPFRGTNDFELNRARNDDAKVEVSGCNGFVTVETLIGKDLSNGIDLPLRTDVVREDQWTMDVKLTARQQRSDRWEQHTEWFAGRVRVTSAPGMHWSDLGGSAPERIVKARQLPSDRVKLSVE